MEGMEDQVEIVARAFVDHYYHLFDNNRPSLSSLYQHTSMLSFEGQKILGVDDISKKLSQLPFDHCKHFISTIDCQPSPLAGGILVFVSGYIQLLGEEHQLRFSQVISPCLYLHVLYLRSGDWTRLFFMSHITATPSILSFARLSGGPHKIVI